MSTPAAFIQEKPGRKKPWLAALLSLLLPGLGQIYCAQDNKGVFLVGMSLLGQWSTGGLSSWILCPVMAVDALMIARKSNANGEIRRWEFFPGIALLNSIPARIMLFVVVVLVAVLTVVHIRFFAANFAPPDK